MYCSPACQKEDWPEHSKVCGKPHTISPYEKLRQMFRLKCYVGNGTKRGSSEPEEGAPPKNVKREDVPRITPTDRLERLYNLGPLLVAPDSPGHIPLLLKLASIPRLVDKILDDLLLAPFVNNDNSVTAAIFIMNHWGLFTSRPAAVKFIRDHQTLRSAVYLAVIWECLSILSVEGPDITGNRFLELLQNPLPYGGPIYKMTKRAASRSIRGDMLLKWPEMFPAIPRWIYSTTMVYDLGGVLVFSSPPDDDKSLSVIIANRTMFIALEIRQLFAMTAVSGNQVCLSMFAAAFTDRELMGPIGVAPATKEEAIYVVNHVAGRFLPDKSLHAPLIEGDHWLEPTMWELACSSGKPEIVKWFSITFPHPTGWPGEVYPDHLLVPFCMEYEYIVKDVMHRSVAIDNITQVLTILPIDENTRWRLLQNILGLTMDLVLKDASMYIVRNLPHKQAVDSLLSATLYSKQFEVEGSGSRWDSSWAKHYAELLCDLCEEAKVTSLDFTETSVVADDLGHRWILLYKYNTGNTLKRLFAVGYPLKFMNYTYMEFAFKDACKHGTFEDIKTWCDAGVLDEAMIALNDYGQIVIMEYFAISLARLSNAPEISIWLLNKFAEKGKLPEHARYLLAMEINPYDTRIHTAEWGRAIQSILNPEELLKGLKLDNLDAPDAGPRLMALARLAEAFHEKQK